MDASDGVANNAGVVQWANRDRSDSMLGRSAMSDLPGTAGLVYKEKDEATAWRPAVTSQTTRV